LSKIELALDPEKYICTLLEKLENSDGCPQKSPRKPLSPHNTHPALENWENDPRKEWGENRDQQMSSRPGDGQRSVLEVFLL
jgi:hypothetical protein